MERLLHAGKPHGGGNERRIANIWSRTWLRGDKPQRWPECTQIDGADDGLLAA